MRRNHGTVVAYLGLVIALGGVSYAAVSLPAKSVGTKQLKRNAVVSSKVKNGSLTRSDFKANQIPRGPKGATGATGAAGTPADLAPGPVIPLTTATPTCESQPGSYCQVPVFTVGDPHWQNWSEGDAAYPPAGYFQDKSGFVHLQGAMFLNNVFGESVDLPIFYLPTALRPTDGLHIFRASRCDGEGVSIVIRPDGSVKPEPFVGLCLTLDGISFYP